MPQRASQWKFGKSLKLHLAKQHETDVCRREKFIEEENGDWYTKQDTLLILHTICQTTQIALNRSKCNVQANLSVFKYLISFSIYTFYSLSQASAGSEFI
jgi:hypothetical protein